MGLWEKEVTQKENVGENKNRRNSGNYEGKGGEKRKIQEGKEGKGKEKRGEMLKTRRTSRGEKG